MVPDPTTLSTHIRGGNYDYLTNQVAWTSSLPSQTLPNSLYLKCQAQLFRQRSMAMGKSDGLHAALYPAGQGQAGCRHTLRPRARSKAVSAPEKVLARGSFTDWAAERTAGPAYGSWWDSYIGNVMGRVGCMLHARALALARARQTCFVQVSAQVHKPDILSCSASPPHQP